MSFLQRFGFKDSPYERPQQHWVCGRARDGQSCNTGPTPDGRCGATYECFPQRKGDRWQCTRDALGGGRCSDGPRPDGTCSRPLARCLPVATLRRRRGRTVLWLALIVTGVLLVGLSSILHEKFVSAGPLSFAHSPEASECNDCHGAADKNIGGLLAAALRSPSEHDSRLCIACHEIGEAPLRAHSLAPGTLADATARARASVEGKQGGGGISALVPHLPSAVNPEGPLGCIRCHREHRGPRGSLTEISDGECQACHVERFNSLSDGHPPFGNWPFNRRTRIAFDHDSHRGKHFPDEDEPFDCARCHVPDQAGETMLVTGFDAACAQCHSGEIQGQGQSGDKGIVFLAVPGLDLDYVADQKLNIGEWPEYAERAIPPLMAVLLSADPAYRDVAPLLKQLDLLDLTSRDEGLEQERVNTAIETLAWSVKKLLDELSRGGQKAFQARMESALGEQLSIDRLASLSGILPADVVAMASSAWFPHLEEELSQRGKGESVAFRTVEEGASTGADAGTAEPVAAQKGDDGDAGDSIEIPDEPDYSEIELGDEGGLSEGGGDILGADTGEEDAGLFGTAGTEESETPPEVEEVAAEATAKAGGWYRQYYTLFYRPEGHSDRFIPQWIASATAALMKLHSPVMRATVELLTDDKTPGHCLKCHSMDGDEESGDIRVNWYSKRPEPGVRPATTFSHYAHLSLTGDAGCLRCHAWREDREEEFMDAYGGPDPVADNSNFRHLETTICTQCHSANMAGDSCVTCHNYHQGKVAPDLAAMTRLNGTPGK